MSKMQSKWRGRLGIALVSLAVLIGLFLAVAVWGRFYKRNMQSVASKPASKMLNIATERKIERYVDSKYRLCFVRFDTDFERQPTGVESIDRAAGVIVGTRPDRPLTKVNPSLAMIIDGPEELHIQGTFSEVKSLNSSFGALGHVDRSITIRPDHGGDEAFRRLGVFLLIRSEISQFPDRPSLLLLAACRPQEGLEILDSEFLGPFADEDIPLVAELAAMLTAEPPDKMGPERARALLGSSNPWLVWLGLSRLYAPKAVTKDDFEKVLESRPVEDVPLILPDMWTALTFTGKAEDLTQAVIDSIRMPGRQQAVLEFYVKNESWFTDLPDFHGIRKAAKEYRQSIADKPDKQEVVRLLDSLLAIKRRVFAGGGKIVTEDDDK